MRQAMALRQERKLKEEEMDNTTLAGLKKVFMDYMIKIVQILYPEWRTETYCVPPVVMNRVPYALKAYDEHNLLVLQEPLKQKEKKRAHSPDAQTQAGPLKRPTLSLPVHTEADRDSALPGYETEASPKAVKESDVQSDFTQQHIMYCLKKIGEKIGPMFIISELKFPDYLGSLSDKLHEFFSKYIVETDVLNHVVHSSSKSYPSSKDLKKDGDFDFLIVHPHAGILVVEVKSAGLSFNPDKMKSQFPLSEAAENKHVFDKNVGPAIAEAVNQIKKMEEVIKHIISDIAPNLPVKKSMILPYVARAQLTRILKNKKKELREGIGGPNVDGESAAQLCICSDDLSSRNDPGNISDEILTRLIKWFSRCFTGTTDLHMRHGMDQQEELNAYFNIVARIVGPASIVRVHCSIRPRVEVRTIGEAVSHIGEMCAKIILTPQQLEILEQWRSLEKVCLYGPPGTGKTVMLILVGLQWMLQGHDVYIVCTDVFGWRVAHLINKQLQELSKPHRTGYRIMGNSDVHFMNLYDRDVNLKDEVEKLCKYSRGDALHVLMDEVHFVGGINDRGLLCRELITDLSKRISGLRLWVATLWNANIPYLFEKKQLTIPLRSCPAVLSEVRKGLVWNDNILRYTCGAVPSPSDGPGVIHLTHHSHSHDGCSEHVHQGCNGEWPVECLRCGTEVANQLQKLHVGMDVRTSPFSPFPLQYRDVFVLTRSSELSTSCGFVQGLVSKGIPCRVDILTPFTHVTTIGDLTDDEVVVGSVNSVRGLECKVVVILHGRIARVDGDKTPDDLLMMDRLWAASRCSSQQIMVNTCEKCVSRRLNR